MSQEPHVVPLSPQPLSSVPRAVWVGGGLLALVTAALAGALVMRTVEPASTAVSATTPVVAPISAASAAMPVGQPVPLIPSQPTAQPQVVAAAKPVPSKPATGTAPATAQNPGTAPAAVCTRCGVVESVAAVKKKGQGTGLGVVAGGVLGGVAGHQVGGGNGKTAMTVLGAIGGGLAGNEVEKRVRSETLFDIRVRMEDGSTRVFQRPQSMALGTRVVVDGTSLRVVN